MYIIYTNFCEIDAKFTYTFYNIGIRLSEMENVSWKTLNTFCKQVSYSLIN